jgi:HlyD family secretion protein
MSTRMSLSVHSNPCRVPGLCLLLAVLPFAIALPGCGQDATALLGYVEAEPVRVSSAVAGRLTTLNVDQGDQVKTDQTLFALEQESEVAALAEAAAKLVQTRAQAADLATGKRPDELAVVEAELRAAQAKARQSAADWIRQSELARKGLASKSALDAARAQRDTDAATVNQLDAQLRAERLAGRDDARSAAVAAVAVAEAQLAQRQWTLDQKTVRSPVAARVEDRYYRIGEWVAAGSPVFSLLAPDAIKVRFWAPEPLLPAFPTGARVMLTCDGCDSPIPATVSFVASEAEFTPPVIYSKENRAKLVFLVEAKLDAAQTVRLRPGQPVDVRLP